MKTKEFFMSLMTIMMMAFVSVSFTSCGGDDGVAVDPNNKAALLIGTWYMDAISIDDTHGWQEHKVTFKSDGTLERIGYLPGYWGKTEELEIGQYSYNVEASTLSCVYRNPETGDSWTQSYTVVDVAKDKLVLTGVTSSGLSFTFFYDRVKE